MGLQFRGSSAGRRRQLTETFQHSNKPDRELCKLKQSAESSSRKHNLGAERELAAMVTSATLMPDSICRSRASRSGQAILTPYSALVRLHLEQSVHFWVPCYKTLANRPKFSRTDQDHEGVTAHNSGEELGQLHLSIMRREA